MSAIALRPVLDASAVLALLQEEPGADEVESLLDGAAMSCVNLSEVIQKGDQHGADVEGLEYDLEALGVEFVSFGVDHAVVAARMWKRGSGLALGDRACLALARTVGGIAVTADSGWADDFGGVPVRRIR